MITLDRAVPAAERSARRIELLVRHRLHGVLSGEHLGRTPGPGSELNDGRPYAPGDDVRRIDWSLSARSNDVQVRTTIADRELETWLVVDTSPSMGFGTDQWTKLDLAAAVVAAYGFTSASTGSRVGTILSGPDGTTVVPAATGLDAVRRTVRAVAATSPGDRSTPRAPGPGARLGPAIERIRRLGRRPGQVVLVSDLLGDDSWIRPLRGLASRCRTEVVEIRDRREDELPAVGLLTLVDPETGRLREVQTANPRLRAAFAAAAADQRRAHRDRARSSGAHHLVLHTDTDWLSDLVRHHLVLRRAVR